jgi:hypothetical protein
VVRGTLLKAERKEKGKYRRGKGISESKEE